MPDLDPELVNLACKLADTNPDQIMAVAWRDDALVVVVQPGPKYIFTAQQIADAIHGREAPRDRDREAKPKAKKAA